VQHPAIGECLAAQDQALKVVQRHVEHPLRQVFLGCHGHDPAALSDLLEQLRQVGQVAVRRPSVAKEGEQVIARAEPRPASVSARSRFGVGGVHSGRACTPSFHGLARSFARKGASLEQELP
jgi:hypothetical protein